MEIQRDSTPIHIGKIITIGNSTPPWPQKPKDMPENMKLRPLPPLVQIDKTPDDIMGEIMDFSDRESIIKFLSTYQKTRPDWDNFRNKIPDRLLDKWAKVLKNCRKFGFIRPKVENEKITWHQVLGFKRNHQNTDQCTLCSRSQRAGDCRGGIVIKNNQRMFKQCWN